MTSRNSDDWEMGKTLHYIIYGQTLMKLLLIHPFSTFQSIFKSLPLFKNAMLLGNKVSSLKIRCIVVNACVTNQDMITRIQSFFCLLNLSSEHNAVDISLPFPLSFLFCHRKLNFNDVSSTIGSEFRQPADGSDAQVSISPTF